MKTRSDHAPLMDTIIAGVSIVGARPTPDAMSIGIRDGRIRLIDSVDAVERWRGPATVRIDGGGLWAAPGFTDAHCHLMWRGLPSVRPSIADASSVAQVLRRVASAAAAPTGDWIVFAPGWRATQFEEGRPPSRLELDSVSAGRPVYLPNFHAGIANTEALRRAGIDQTTPDPHGGRIGRDDDGVLTGALEEQPAIWLLERALPAPTTEESAAAVMAAAPEALRAGVTSIIDPAVSLDEYTGYQHLANERTLPLRVAILIRIDRDPAPRSMQEAIGRLSLLETPNRELLHVLGIKLFVDGAFFHGQAYLSDPYAGGPDRRHLIHAPEVVKAVVAAALEADWTVGAHASGDAAIDVLLDAFEQPELEGRAAKTRSQLIHGHLMTRAQVTRVARLGLVVVPQPQAIRSRRAEELRRLLGPERASWLWPLASLVDAGVCVAASSDSPIYPIEPLDGWGSAETRLLRSGEVHSPAERVDRWRALLMHTAAGAFARFAEQDQGAIEVDRLADIVLLEGPSPAEPETDLGDLSVALTMVGGQVRYES